MKSTLRIVVAAMVLLLCSVLSFAQTYTARNVSMIANSKGYYEYLPQGYSSGTQTYPVIVNIHGSGETGNGGGDLSKLLVNGLSRVINTGQFPTSFTVKGQTYRFIVISPQFVGWPTELDVQGVINYVTQNYRVNLNRIYLTGMSMGGGSTWNYAGYNSGTANRLAAIVPVCGASTPATGRARNIANANLPVWATHNDNDPTVGVSNTNLYVQYINAVVPAPNPLAKKTIFNSDSHDAWTRTYDPNFTEGGLNIYQWMLQYQRGQIVLPVLLSNYTVTLNTNNKVTINWTTAQETDNDHFTIERSSDGSNFTTLTKVEATNNAGGSAYQYVDESPLSGTGYYRLSQSDISGKTEIFETKSVTINNAYTNKLELYPNPARENITLRLNDAFAGKLQVRITTSSGQVVKTVDFTKTEGKLQQHIPVTDIPAGNYLLEVKGKGISYSGLFIKQ